MCARVTGFRAFLGTHTVRGSIEEVIGITPLYLYLGGDDGTGLCQMLLQLPVSLHEHNSAIYVFKHLSALRRWTS